MAAEKAGVGFMNQRDMSVALFAFIGYTITRNDFFELPKDEENMTAVTHVWRIIGNLLGIADEFNIFQGDLKTIRLRSQAVFQHIITPAFVHAPEKFESMSYAAIEGLRSVVPELNINSLRFMANVLNNVPGYYLTEQDRQAQLEYLRKYPHYFEEGGQLKEIIHDIKNHPETCSAYLKLPFSQKLNLKVGNFYIVNVCGRSSSLRVIANKIVKGKFNFLIKYPILAIVKYGKDMAYVDNSIMNSYLRDQKKIK